MVASNAKRMASSQRLAAAAHHTCQGLLAAAQVCAVCELLRCLEHSLHYASATENGNRDVPSCKLSGSSTCCLLLKLPVKLSSFQLLS
jgi:hypothetical protein